MEILIDKRAAAEALGISTVTVDRLRKSGKLPYRQIGGLVRFCPDDVEQYIKAAGVNTRAEADAVQ
jgi:excisionase family DNA binding protein